MFSAFKTEPSITFQTGSPRAMAKRKPTYGALEKHKNFHGFRSAHGDILKDEDVGRWKKWLNAGSSTEMAKFPDL